MLDDAVKGKISVWIGITHKTLTAFNAYIEKMEELDSGSPIHQDFGCGFID